MHRTYKFRLYPSKEQEETLSHNLEICRYVYNTLLEWLNEQDEVNKYELQNRLPSLKQEHPELKQVYSKALQYEVHRLFHNLHALSQSKKKGNKVGRLRFKSSQSFKTIHYNQSGFKIMKTGNRLDKLHISKVGNLPIRMHRPVKGDIKQVVIKHYRSGKWYASIMVEQENEVAEQPIKKAVGIDVGLKHYCSDSDGRQFENPEYLKKSAKKLERRQKKLSRMKHGSNNSNKQRARVARQHERIENQRNDFLHKLSHYYVNNYDLIAVEDLNIKNMTKNPHLAKKITDASWNKFTELLSYKAERAGKTVVKVNPQGTSQEHKHGQDIDRDYNASLNILEKGIDKLGSGRPESTPADTKPLQELQHVPASQVVESGSHPQNL